jgi:protein TonB
MANHGHFGHSGKASNHAYGVGEDSALQQRLQANAHGCYPLRARRFRFQGTARLAFCVDTQGMATQTRLSESSGHNSLDEAALDCVLKKAQPLPASSRGRCFVAPIAFVAR